VTEAIRLKPLPFSLRIAADKLSAFVKFVPGNEWENNESNLLRLLAAIRDAGVVQADESMLRSAMSEIVAGREACIARGEPAVHGEPGRIETFFDAEPAKRAWEESDSKKVDFHKTDVANNVKPEELLAQLVPPTPGRNGVNVLGHPLIARPGRLARITPGRNVRLSEDETKAYSEIEGCAKRVRWKIAVDHVKIVQGDVDFHSGNIDFFGDVVVLGDVKETFTISAHGSIKVHGTVDRASLKAGADIIVAGGLYGKERIEVVAEGDVTIGFAENATIRAGGSLYVRAAMVNCTARANETIQFRSVGKALIGGSVYAAHGIEANTLGNPRIPTKTVVEFGPSAEIVQRIRSLKNEGDKTQDEEQRSRIRGELESLLEEYQRQSKARVAVRQTAYPGVILVCGKASFDVNHEIDGMTFYKLEDRNEISTRAYGREKE
jgi:uncharacterized protein (DUF342 family)